MPRWGFHLNHVSKGKGGSAYKAACYVLREQEYAKYHDLVQADSLNLPAWTKGQSLFFFAMADQYEDDGARVASQFTLNLPRELPRIYQVQAIETFVHTMFGGHANEKHVVVWGLHEPNASDDRPFPHCHMLVSMRTLDGIVRGPDTFFQPYNRMYPERGGAARDRWFYDRSHLAEMHKEWNAIVEQALADAGAEVHGAKYQQERCYGYGMGDIGFALPDDEALPRGAIYKDRSRLLEQGIGYGGF
jgi:DNA repair protein SbcC/Rad50